MNLKESIGVRVRAARNARELSQVQLAEMVERTTETVSNIERGVTAPTIETLERLSKALGVPMVEFFEGFDRPNVDKKRMGLELEIRDLLTALSVSDLKIAKKQILALISRDD